MANNCNEQKIERTHMHIVSVINYKGGVGKTSLTANLAAELAFRGKKILLVDLDAQASLTFSLISPDEWNKDYAPAKTIKSWFDSFEQGKLPADSYNLLEIASKVRIAFFNRPFCSSKSCRRRRSKRLRSISSSAF